MGTVLSKLWEQSLEGLKKASKWDAAKDKLFTDRKQGTLFLNRKNRVFRLFRVINQGVDGERVIESLPGIKALGLDEAVGTAWIDAACADLDQ